MISEIPINQGVFKAQNQRSVRNTAYAENLVNLFIDTAGSNYDRPTLDMFEDLEDSEPIGMYYFDGVFVVVTSTRNIYTLDSSAVVTNITSATLPGTGIPVFVDDGNSLYIAGGGTIIKWDGVGTTTQTLGGSPPEATHLVYLDGFLIANRRLDSENNKVIQFADFEDTDSWNALNIFSAVADPDQVMGHTVSQRELYVIGQVSTEIWQNIGADPVPFARTFVWNYGTCAKYSILSVDNSVFFLDQDRRIRRFSGREQVKISEQIDEEIATYSTVSDCRSYSFTWNGSVHVLFIFPTEGKGWSIDLRNNQWSEWRGFENGWVRARVNCLFYSQQEQMTLAGDFSSGKIWQFSETLKTDADLVFKRLRTFCFRDAGAAIKKNARMIRINLKRDVAAEYIGTTPETNPTIELRWKDDGKEWSNYRQFSLGEKGNNMYYAEFYCLGIYRTRQYEIQFSDPSELNITSIETDEEVMAE